MKLILFLTIFTTTFALHSKKALEIHIFNNGKADGQLVIFPSGYSILIDCGDKDYSKASNSKYIAKRIEALLGKKKVDVFVLTHYHTDHFGKKGVTGIWYLMEKAGFTFGKFLKRDAGTYSGSKISDCSKSKITWKYAGQMSTNMVKNICYATSSKDKTKLSKIAENAHRCNTKQIAPPDAGASVLVLMRDGLGVKSKDSGNKISRNSVGSSTPVAENDFSVCMRIQYQKFVYATCGDLTGYTYESGGKKYHDVETSVAPMMGEVDLLKVNHHGSKSATNEKWSKTLKPTVAVFTCGDGTTSAPYSRPLKNLHAVGTKMYTTGKDCNHSAMKKYSGIVEMGDDVVITVPTGGKTFTVASPSGKNKKTYNIKQNKKAATTCKTLD